MLVSHLMLGVVLVTAFPVSWGTWPQWISATAATILVIGALWVTFKYGKRANVNVDADIFPVQNHFALRVTVSLKNVSRLQIWPVTPRWCDHHGCPQLHTGSSVSRPVRNHIWDLEPPLSLDPSALHPNYRHLSEAEATRATRQWFGWFRPEAAFEKRRKAWACPNQKVPSILIEEIRLSNDGTNFAYKAAHDCRNVLEGEYIEPSETMERSTLLHLAPDDDVIGWKVTFSVWGRKWKWFRTHPSSDCWRWHGDTIILRGDAGPLQAPAPEPLPNS